MVDWNLEPLPFISFDKQLHNTELNRASWDVDQLYGNQPDQQLAKQSGLAIANDAAVAHLPAPYPNQAKSVVMGNEQTRQLESHEQMAIQANSKDKQAALMSQL